MFFIDFEDLTLFVYMALKLGMLAKWLDIWLLNALDEHVLCFQPLSSFVISVVLGHSAFNLGSAGQNFSTSTFFFFPSVQSTCKIHHITEQPGKKIICFLIFGSSL